MFLCTKEGSDGVPKEQEDGDGSPSFSHLSLHGTNHDRREGFPDSQGVFYLFNLLPLFGFKCSPLGVEMVKG